MSLSVREVLTPLGKRARVRLCSNRGLSVSGTKSELRRRLTYSYRGDVEAVLDELRREDLLVVGRYYADRFDLQGLARLRVDDVRKLLRSRFFGVLEEEEPTQADARDRGSADHNVDLYLSGREDEGERTEGIRHLALGVLQREAAAAERATVLSAYYVCDVLSDLLGVCSGEVRVVLNGLGGQRLVRQVDELENLQARLAETGTECSIRLGFSKGVFHTKLYLFENKSGSAAWIGSANATGAGLNGHNEEILVRVSPAPESVMSYAESVWLGSEDLSCYRREVDSLPAFFRTGTLYYESYAQLQKTLNPFRKFVTGLPDRERRKISPLQTDFADAEAGIGAFNLGKVYAATRGGAALSEPTKKHVRFRDYAIETCYGYWVPECLVGDIDKQLEAASEQNRELLESWRDWLSEDEGVIVNTFRTYLGDVKSMLEEEGVDWRKHRASPSLFEATDAIHERIEKLKASLSHEGWLARHSQKFVPSEVPEIWEDEAARGLFEDSFFDSLALASTAQKRRRVVVMLLNALGAYTGTADDLHAALEDRVRDPDWYKENFGDAVGDDRALSE